MTGLSFRMFFPAAAAPPAVADAGAVGDNPNEFARENHTHASKARKARAPCAADGTMTWVFDPPFADGVIPRVVAIAEAAGPDVVNVQLVEPPTNLQCKLLVNRTQRSVARSSA